MGETLTVLSVPSLSEERQRDVRPEWPLSPRERENGASGHVQKESSESKPETN